MVKRYTVWAYDSRNPDEGVSEFSTDDAQEALRVLDASDRAGKVAFMRINR